MASTRGKMRLGPTEAGRVLLLGTVFFGLAAQLVPAFGVVSALVVVMLTVLIVGFILRPRIAMTAHLPDHVVAGQDTQFRYTIRNVARVPAYDLSLRFADLPAAIEHVAGPDPIGRLAPGESTEVVATMRARRRGKHPVPLPICESSFPFNLLRFSSVRKDREALTVLPVFYRLRLHLSRLTAESRHGLSGSAGQAEVSPEYAGNRPFLPGDSPRRIDTRAWARLSVPATKQYHNDSDSHVGLVLDTRIGADGKRPGADEIPELEAAVSLSASIAFTIQRHCLIDWLLAGPELHEFATWPRTMRVDRVHEALATVEAAESYDLNRMTDALLSRFHRISQVIFVLLRSDKTYSDLLDLAVAARCHCTSYLVVASDLEGPRHDAVRTGPWTLIPVGTAEDILAGRVGPL
ncbi:DUF58 domain-containing protein [Anaerobaca lacustris]|uniref:DUF58 domain-containing protein n=1 Tax=Anaerobaca lacustris TaxID=3044600 RepID=A0AAW6TYE5_9BACT|nr:DUF58 domain-containing protein [Sedimentisphaerales bacterium M17dextr]